MPKNIAASKIYNGVISLLWQLRCHCIPDHDKFSSLSNKNVVAIFPNVCLWRRSYAQNWEVLTLKNCYSIAPPSYASAASVVASYGPRFFSTVRFGKIRATCENFLGKWFTAPRTGSRGDVFVVRTSKPVENLWINGLFWSRYSFVTHSIWFSKWQTTKSTWVR